MHLARQSKRNAGRLMLLIVFCFPSLMAGTIYFPNYVLPTYPPMLNRAGVQGSFAIEVFGSNGCINEARIVSHEIFLPNGKRLDTPPPLMEKGIISALKKWEYDQDNHKESINFQITIEFRLADKQRASARSSNSTYEIREIDGRPVKIIIEEDRIRSKELYE